MCAKCTVHVEHGGHEATYSNYREVVYSQQLSNIPRGRPCALSMYNGNKQWVRILVSCHHLLSVLQSDFLPVSSPIGSCVWTYGVIENHAEVWLASHIQIQNSPWAHAYLLMLHELKSP